MEDCLTFPVNQKCFQVLPLAEHRDKRLPFDTRIALGLQENVFGNQFSTFDSPRDHHQGVHRCAPLRERGSAPQVTRTNETLFTRDDTQNRGTIPMPPTLSSLIRVKFLQNYMVGQQRQQIPELQFDNFPNPQSFLDWKIRFKKKATTCSDFPSDAMLWITEVGDG